MALTMCWYPVQRQKLPVMPSRISRSEGWGWSASNPTAVMIMPGVQKPHCRPCCSQKASCNGCSWPSVASPSIVVISEPSAWTANIVQDFAARPSTSTVQAPHCVVSHPTWVPVSRRCSRRKCTRSRRGSTSACLRLPLTVTVTLAMVVVSGGGYSSGMSAAWLVSAFLLQAAGGTAPRGASISGRVTAQDSGQPLPRIVVTLRSADHLRQVDTTTDPDGRYLFTEVVNGRYFVTADNDDHVATYLPRSLDVEVGGASPTDVDLALARALAIEGRVFDPLG